jgi:Zn-dependent M28 family amino/carboxypeptidase
VSRSAIWFALVCTLGLGLACATRKPPAFDVPAAAALQKEVVYRLSGGSDIRPGVKIANRTTPENKKEAREYLAGLLKRFGLKPERQAYSAEGENVFATLACGRRDAEVVVFGAHYDSARNSPGANDNATGVAVVAAVAEQLTRARTPRVRDVVFVFFDEEERGLRGSRAFAQMLADAHRPIAAVHTIDQMGWDKNGNRAVELELPYAGAEDAYQAAALSLGMKIVFYTTTEAGSDHSAFRRLGFKAVGITEEYRHNDTTPYIHRLGDVAETVNFDYLASTTRLVARVIQTLAITP